MDNPQNQKPQGASSEVGAMNNVENLIMSYTGQNFSQQQEQEQPRTFVLECNKSLSVQDGDSLETGQWTNNFPSIKLKRGDVISVNSAFLSSRGSGDLLQFDETNNKTRVVFEYYNTNDNVNGKRPSYNMSYSTIPVKTASWEEGWDGQSIYPTGQKNYDQDCWMKCYPVNYRPMRLYRLMNTFIQKTSAIGDGSDLPAFTDPTTIPPSPNKEPFWGFNNSPALIEGSIEDDYVPNLFRDPIVNINEHNAITSNCDNNLFNQRFNEARIWYVATRKSIFGACSDDATMRIYFAGTGGAQQRVDRNQQLLDSLNLVKSFRVGQYVKFFNVQGIFGLMAYTPDSGVANIGTQQCGPKVFYCAGYAEDGAGFSAVADKYEQFGTLGGGAWKLNPMGLIMKINRIYINTSPLNPTGNNTTTEGASGKEDLEYCPFIEVQCDNAISLAWGNPNAYTWVDNPHGIGSPYHNGPWTGTPTAINPPPFDKVCHDQGGLQLRTWAAHNLKAIVDVTDKMGVDCKSGNFYPQDDNVNKDAYVCAINHYVNYNSDLNASRTGYQMYSKEFNMGALQGTEQSFLQATTGNNPATTDFSLPQQLPAINFNMKCINKDGSSNSDVYADDLLADNVYAGARLPAYYEPFNDPLEYTTDNYWKIKKNTTLSFGQMVRPIYIENTADPLGKNYNWADPAGGQYNGDYRNPMMSGKGANPSNYLPEWANLGFNHNGLFVSGKNSQPVRFYVGASVFAGGAGHSIDNTNAFKSYDWGDTIVDGEEAFDGTDNFIIATGNCPPPFTAKKTSDGATPIFPENTEIQKAFSVWGGFKEWVAGGGPYDPPTSWAENNWKDSAASAVPTGGTISQSFTYDLGNYDLATVMHQFESCVYVLFTDFLGRTEVMYVQILPGYLNSQGAPTWFGNTANTNTPVRTFVNGQVIVGAPPLPATRTSQNNMRAGDYTIPRFYIIKRDIFNTGLLHWNGYFTKLKANEIGVNTLEADKTQFIQDNCCWFQIIDSLADFAHQYDFKDSPRDLLPTTQQNVFTSKNYNDMINGLTFGYMGSDFAITTIPNQPYYDDIGDVENMTSDMIWIYNENIHSGNPTETTSGGGQAHGHTGALSWGIHYDYMDLELDASIVYYSPSDIASIITQQLQEPHDLYRTDNSGGRNPNSNGVLVGSKGKNLQNPMYRVIHGPSTADNTENTSDGYLNSAYHQGDFCFFVGITDKFMNNLNVSYNWSNMFKFQMDESMVQDGFYPVWIRNEKTCINANPSSYFFTVPGWTQRPPTANRNGVRGRQIYCGNNARIDMLPNGQERAFQANFYGYGQNSGSMFIGTSSPTLNFNDQFSRFEWEYLHQPLYKQWDDVTSTDHTGGSVIANIWINAIDGMDNWDRFGGVNVVNWCAPTYEYGQFNKRDVGFQDVLTSQDVVGKAFMNKLGFTDAWMSDNSNSDVYGDTCDTDSKFSSFMYKPNGTTASDYNVNQAISYTTSTMMKDPFMEVMTDVMDVGWGTPANIKEELSLHSFTQGLQNEVYTKIGSTQYTVDDKKFSDTTFTGDYLGYDHLPSMAGSGFDFVIDTTNNVLQKMNLDDVKLKHFTMDVNTSQLRATELAKKTDIGYFFILSDLIDKHEFYGSANDGSNLNAIGILSKNYENNDFYFSFQSPVEFYVKQDKTITSIKTRITTPSLTPPLGLDFNSSVIYTIIRQNPTPEPDVPPVWLQQQYDYELSQQLAKQMGVPWSGFTGGSLQASIPSGAGIGGATSGQSGLSALRARLVQSVLSPSSSQASTILNTETQISQNLSRMSLAQRMRAIRTQGVALDPSQAQIPIINPTAEDQLGLQTPVQRIPTQMTPAIDPALLHQDLGIEHTQEESAITLRTTSPTIPEGYTEEEDVLLQIAGQEHPQAIEALQQQALARKKGDDPTGGGRPSDLPLGRTPSGLPEYDIYDPRAEDPTSGHATDLPAFGEMSPREPWEQAMALTQGWTQPSSPSRARSLEAERKHKGRMESARGVDPLALTAGLEEHKGVSLYEAVARTVTDHPHPRFPPTSENHPSDWVDKSSEFSPSWTAKKHPSRPYENPYDIRTWTGNRLRNWEGDKYVHLSEEARHERGYFGKSKKEEKKVGDPRDKLSVEAVGLVTKERARRGTQHKYDYGHYMKKGAVTGIEPKYKKASQAPSGYTHHAEAHLHPRGLGKIPEKSAKYAPPGSQLSPKLQAPMTPSMASHMVSHRPTAPHTPSHTPPRQGSGPTPLTTPQLHKP